MSTTETILCTARRRRAECEHTDTLAGWMAYLTFLRAVGADHDNAPLELRRELLDAVQRADDCIGWNDEMMRIEHEGVAA